MATGRAGGERRRKGGTTERSVFCCRGLQTGIRKEGERDEEGFRVKMGFDAT